MTWGRVALLCGVLAIAAALGAGALAATRSPGLDRSFGKNGVVEVTPPVKPPEGSFFSAEGFAVASDRAVYVTGGVYPCFPVRCRLSKFLMRLEPDGDIDRAFGHDGAVALHGEGEYPSVGADGRRAIVFEQGWQRLVLRRFLADGKVDLAFGSRGTVTLPCKDCREAEIESLDLPGGGLMIVVSHAVERGKESLETVASKVRLSKLRPDGARDESFGHSGTVAFQIPKKGGIDALERVAGGAILFGGVTGGGSGHHPWLWRVTAAGHADMPFNRGAARSLRRLGRLSDFPRVISLLPRGDGTVSMVGTIHEHLGFVLRLRRDGRIAAGFGRRGLVHLPATVEAATAGTGGSIFLVGQRKRAFYYSAFRVLASGRLDPAYRGRHGITVPLPGEGVGVQSLGGGLALVINIGYFECRQGCPPEPGLARFRE